MHNNLFTKKEDIIRLSNSKKFIFFGAGNIAEKTLHELEGINLEFIIDNSTNLDGDFQLGVNVHAPSFLSDIDINDFLIVITTTSFSDVSAQLDDLGFESGNNYVISPVLNGLLIIDRVENIQQKLIFSSGSPKQDNPLYGGGIYELTVNGAEWKHKKVIDGNCYGITRYKDNFVALDTDMGLIEFNKDYEIIRKKEMPYGSRAHGVSYSEIHNLFFINCTYLDKVLFIDESFNIYDELSISYKHERGKKPFHHINDCAVYGDSLYISMFSETGNWKSDLFDGAIIEYDILTKHKVGSLVRDLWMPHNVKFINGSFTFLDSLKGNLRGNNAQILGTFPAFTRGLDYNNELFFIGQSKNRNFSKTIGVSNNISIDAGIIAFDPETKVSRFLQLPPKLSEIHSILCI